MHSVAPSSWTMQTCQSPMVQISSSFKSKLRFFQSGTKVVTQDETHPKSARNIAPSWTFVLQLHAMLTLRL